MGEYTLPQHTLCSPAWWAGDLGSTILHWIKGDYSLTILHWAEGTNPRPYWSGGDLLLDHRPDVPHDAFRLTAHWIPRQPATTSQSQPQALKQTDLSHKLCHTNIQSTRSWCEVKLITARLLPAYLPSACLPTYLLPVSMSVCLPVRFSACLNTNQPIYLSAYLHTRVNRPESW